jgi:hypothetical protein
MAEEDVIKALQGIYELLQRIDSRLSRQTGTQEEWQQLKEANTPTQQ